MRKNVAGQNIGAQLVSATDGSAFTGSVTVRITGDAGTQAVGTVGSGACTHEGNGYHTYAPSQAETNYDLIAFTFTGSGAIPVTVQVFTRYDANVTHFGGSAGTFASGLPAVNLTQWKGTAPSDLASLTNHVQCHVASMGANTIHTNVFQAGAITATAAPNLDAAVSTRATPAQVNAEVLDVLATDTFAEPTGAPAATATLVSKWGYLYMALRNKVTVTGSEKTFYDDGGGAEWSKSLSDDGTTYTEAEGA